MRVFLVLMWLFAALAPSTVLSQTTVTVGKYQGSSRCYRCHEEPSQFDMDSGVTRFIQLTEAKDWAKKDKHARAFINVRDTRLGKQMCEILGIEAHAAECASCHSNPHWINNQATGGAGIDLTETIYKESGVTCESCHGASTAWDLKHSTVDWRRELPAGKIALGMEDVRNPVARATMCFSCHIGDMAQNRVVTHEMYAAGHPPLPSIELETFLEKMPGHWRTVEEKKQSDFQFKDEFFEVNGMSAGDYTRLKSVVLGAAVAYRTSVQLISDQASSEKGRETWPQLELFDCYACHHDLKIPSWRQARGNDAHGYKLRPGRPQMIYWPTTLLQLGVGRIEGDSSLAAVNGPLAQLGASLNQRPFGTPEVIANAANAIIRQLDLFITSLEQASLKKDDAPLILAQLCQLADSPTIDYESARQIGWAFTIILKQYPPQNHADFADPVERLEIQLKLSLPSGQEREIQDELPAALKAASSYEPDAFRLIMKELATLLAQ